MSDCERYKRLFGANVAVIGASDDNEKFSNKAMRALISCGYNVFPVNPKGGVIEDIVVYKSLDAINDYVDFVSVYLSSDKVLNSGILESLKNKKVKGVILNPGTQDETLIKKLTDMKFKVLTECTIRSLGKDPNLL